MPLSVLPASLKRNKDARMAQAIAEYRPGANIKALAEKYDVPRKTLSE